MIYFRFKELLDIQVKSYLERMKMELVAALLHKQREIIFMIKADNRLEHDAQKTLEISLNIITKKKKRPLC